METENDYRAEDDIGSLGSAVKLLIMAGSLAAASVVGVYVHPHLLPLATEKAPQLWREVRDWMTAPVLFLLLNLVVGTLYLSSSLMSKAQAEEEKGRPAPARGAALVQIGQPSPPPAGGAAAPKSTPKLIMGNGGGSRVYSGLARSKSEQIPLVSSKAEVGVAGRLKKAGTFESSPRGKLKPVVVVADPLDDAPAGNEEVDKQAEAFISKFYHKVKLQRLHSLLRQQQEQQQQQQLHL